MKSESIERYKYSKLLAVWRFLKANFSRFLFLFFLLFSELAFGANWVLELTIQDSPEIPSDTEIDSLEARANANDIDAKQQFAAAYLYEHLSSKYWDRGCRHLQYGHKCRILANRSQTGRRMLAQILDSEGEGPVNKVLLARLQADFAYRRMLDAGPSFDPNHPACQEAVRYYQRAIANQRSIGSGQSCTARRFSQMLWHGQCIEKDQLRSKEYILMTSGCVQD